MSNDEINQAYVERDMCVAFICLLAHKLGWNVGLKQGDDPNWPLVFVDSPLGQLSWHVKREELMFFPSLSPYLADWDGHSSEEKYKRMRNLV